jgi:hypothetical protein
MDLLKNGVIFIFIIFTVASCKKGGTAGDPKPVLRPVDQEIIRIPVVVHVIYSDTRLNISDEKIHSQIKTLNEDFRKLNADHAKVPAQYRDLVADVGIEFMLASKDPNGNYTTGITRTFSQLTGWHGRILREQDTLERLPLYNTAKGGHDAWPRDKYLNIWIADLSDGAGFVILAGYAQFPGAPAGADGIVIDPRCFGNIAPLNPRQEFGRTATHEIGHWLNLSHIYSVPSDDVEDTPPGCAPNLNSVPASSLLNCTNDRIFMNSGTDPSMNCGPSPMNMNFMDYVADQNMYMFTIGQKARMRAVFSKGGARELLYKNSRNLGGM